MQIIENELLVAFDVDSTLVFSCSSNHKEAFQTNYYGLAKWVRPHEQHIDLLKSFKKRGYFVIVNSANGSSWGNEIVKLLELESYVDLVMTKVKSYVDDLPCEKWMVDHIYIPENK